MALDTYDIVRELRAVGFEEAQADALSRLLKRAHDVDVGHLATKVDLEGAVLRLEGAIDSATVRLDGKIDFVATGVDGKIDAATARLDGKIDAAAARLDGKIETFKGQLDAKLETTKAQLEAKIEAAKAEMIKWMFGTIGLQTLVIVGTVVVLVRGLGRP